MHPGIHIVCVIAWNTTHEAIQSTATEAVPLKSDNVRCATVIRLGFKNGFISTV